jgi:hypothetical protein
MEETPPLPSPAERPGEAPAPRDRFARRLVRRARLPRLSGRASVAWLILCLLLPAFLIPAAVRLPIWIDFEIVLGIWWLVWLLVLARLLYTGQRVTDDHALQAPRSWFGARGAGKKPPRQSASGSGWLEGLNWGGGGAFDSEAFAIGCLVVVGLILLVGGIWFIVEIAVPVTAFLLYLLVRGMLACVVNDRHHCRDHVGRSLAWSGLWATVYIAPLALAVWFVHYAHRTPGAP